MKSFVAAILFGLFGSAVTAEETGQRHALFDLSIEELSKIVVTSAAGRPTSVAGAATSIYVITSDQIRRSGVTTIPEALRLAPNLQVARRSTVEYAITARGFNNAVGNKLLVLIDGRTVYTPVYSGVFWEMQDTLIEDIDRIEVISGAGATLWGANAVNGVINIRTKPVVETQGLLVRGDAGNAERGGAIRFGGARMRGYAQFREWDESVLGAGTTDEWRRAQIGFRAELGSADSRHTLQGDLYRGESADRGFAGEFAVPRHKVDGNNLLWRWRREQSIDSATTVQVYWDHMEREEFVIFQPRVDVLDFDFEHNLRRGDHHWIWGTGYRRSEDEVTPGFFSSFQPASRTLEWFHLFLQDEIRLADGLDLTLGIKAEHNSYTQFEFLPNARIAWAFRPAHTVWAALSRAVRAPARYDRDIFFPEAPPHVVAGGRDFRSEVADVVELGLRGQPTADFSYSVAAFHHDWDHLRSGTPLPLPISLVNNIEGKSYGLEGWASWQVMQGWRLSGGFTTLGKELSFRRGSAEDAVGVDNPTLHNDPDYQWTVESWHSFGNGVELDLRLYGVDELTIEPVPGYTELDVRLGWQVNENLEVALVGRNLLDSSHPEFGAEPFRPEFERSGAVVVRWIQ